MEHQYINLRTILHLDHVCSEEALADPRGRIFPGAGVTAKSVRMLTPAAPIAAHCAHQH